MCLNQSSNSLVARDVGRIVEVEQQIDLARDLGARLDHDEAREHVAALEDAAAGRDQRLVEAQIAVRRDAPHDLVDHRLAGVEVDRRARDRQRVDPLGVERGVDRREPPALAVADQVDAPAAVLDGAIDDLDVVLDRRVRGLARSRRPSRATAPARGRRRRSSASGSARASSRRCTSRGRPAAAAPASARPGASRPRSRAAARAASSNTISCGVAQDGARRSGSARPSGGRRTPPDRARTPPSSICRALRAAAAPASSQLSRRPEAMLGEGTGGHCGTTVIFDLLAKKLRSTSEIPFKR